MTMLNHLIDGYGYWGIFAFLAVGMFGIPVADEVLLMGAGYLISMEELQPVPTLLAVILGSLSGISLNYMVGRTIGLKLLSFSGRFYPSRLNNLDYVQGWFNRVGKWGLLVGYFFPGIRHLTPVVAGISRLHPGIFALLAVSGCCLWSLTLLSLGYVLGEERAVLWEYLHAYLLVIPGLFILAALLYVLVRRRLRPKDYAAAVGCSAKR
jgi:membrane protein DedA with SNARE-associated domain